MIKMKSKKILDKRILAHNPFQKLDNQLYTEGYNFLDFMKLNAAIFEIKECNMSRNCNYINSIHYRDPIGVNINGIKYDLCIRTSFTYHGQNGNYFFTKDTEEV